MSRCLQPPSHAGSPLTDSSILKMGAVCSPKRRLTQDLRAATSQKMTFVNIHVSTLMTYEERMEKSNLSSQ
jgi:hypothetical protein